MVDLEKELKKAQDEMHGGSPERAIAILKFLKREYNRSSDDLILTEEERLRGLIKVLNNLGVVQKNCGSLEEATNSLEEAYEIAVTLGEKSVRMQTGILSNLGLLYSRRRKYTKALDSFNKALNLSNEFPDKVTTGLTIKLHNNRALFFVRFGEPDKAREELALALESAHEEAINGNESEREAWLTANLAMVHAELGTEEVYNPSRQEELYRQARTMFLRSADLYGQEGYIQNRLKQIINAAEINIRLRAPEEARRLLVKARREAERMKYGRIQCEIAHVAVELALVAPDRENLLIRVQEATKTRIETNPADLPIRWARLEGILRRAGRTDALKLLSDSKKTRGINRNSEKTTPK